MIKKNTPCVRFTMRMPEKMHRYYKRTAFDKNSTMMDIIVEQLAKHQIKEESKALHNDTQVSE